MAATAVRGDQKVTVERLLAVSYTHLLAQSQHGAEVLIGDGQVMPGDDTAVSYTHLDVYKRQGAAWNAGCGSGSCGDASGKRGNDFAHSFASCADKGSGR